MGWGLGMKDACPWWVWGGGGGMRAFEIRPWNPLLFEVSEDFRVFLLLTFPRSAVSAYIRRLLVSIYLRCLSLPPRDKCKLGQGELEEYGKETDQEDQEGAT